MVTDFSMTSALLYFGGAAAAPFYPIYLWVTLGNGFRYGLPYLAASVSASVCGFFMVVLTSDFWQAQLPLGAGLLAALIIIPAYAASLIRKLTEAKAQAVAANQAKSHFLASMSHELRTPLNAIIGMSDLLRQSRLEDDQREMTSTIRASGGALLSLIDDILDFSRIEAGEARLMDADFELQRELTDLAAMFRPEATRKAIAFHVHVAADVPLRLRGSVRHLRQVLINLVANAIKFTHRGYVFVKVARVPSVTGRQVRLCFEISDTGIGIDPERQERIFERFTQADDSIHRRYGGTGLGLAISRSLVNLMGGSISLVSLPRRGSTFTVELPLAIAPIDGRELVCPPVRVVVASPDPALAETVGRALAPLGLEPVPLPPTDRPLQAIATAAADAETATVALVDPRCDPSGVAGFGDTSPCAGPRPVPLVFLGTDGTALEPRIGFIASLPIPCTTQEMVNVLSLGLAFASDADGGDAAAKAARTPKYRHQGLRILVAEDNPVNQKVTKRILEHAGHDPTIVDDGANALHALEAHSFDLLILDVNMPSVGGIDVIKLHRFASLGEPRTPIVALSADASAETQEACTAAGADVYLTKPVEPHRLLSVIDDLRQAALDRRQPGRDERPAAPADSDTGGRVTSIASHPRYRADAQPAINRAVLQSLIEFGGDDFVFETLEEFVANTERLVAQITDAIGRADAPAFRDAVHALRGTSGNVGAEAIWRLCQDMRGIGGDRLKVDGAEYLDRLTREFARYRQELARYAASQQHGSS
jgi:two-component system sensor histidine kinase RpfC